MATVILRELNTVDLATSGPQIALLSLDDGGSGSASRTLTIAGVALNVAAVTLTAASSADRQSAGVQVGSGGHFTATVNLSVRANLDFVILEARDAATGANTFDRCVAQLGRPTALNLPDATLANIDRNVLSYLAGTPDRIIPSRTFVQLHLPVGLEHITKLTDLYLGALDGPISRIGPSILKKFDGRLKALAKSVDEDNLPIDKFYNAAEASLSSILEGDAAPLLAGPAKEAKELINAALIPGKEKSGRSANKGGKVTARPVAFGNHAQKKAFLPFAGRGGKDVLAAQWIKGLRSAQRVGVLFSDRLRIVPVGLVVGEPLYKLALSPGEEVQLRQSSETRKRVSLSEILDRETPIGVSVDAGSSSSSAHSNSIAETAAFHNETSSTSMARLRAQHKTTLEVSSEESTGYTTTRTLRNTNLQRSQIHTFFKLYRKEQITLERHDAQLCLKFEVQDPAREARSAFLSRFHRLDPNNSDNWDLPEFGDVQLTETRNPFTAPADQQPWAAIGGTHDRWRTLDIANLAAFLRAPAGYELIDKPRLTMTRVVVFTENSDIAGGEGTHVYESALTRLADAAPNVDLQPAFTTSGGKVRVVRWPEPLGSDMRLKLDVSFAFRMEGHPPVVPFVELGTAITAVTFKVSATFGPGGALLQDRADKVLRRKRDAAATFEPDAVYALAAGARADYPGSVIDRAVSENFSHLPLDRLASLGRIFDLDKSIIESVPYWASRSASETHLALKILLERLPKRVDSAAVLTPELTGALAFVYLPIRHGMESDALKLLKEIDRAQRTTLIDDFRNLRETRFGFARPSMGSPPADVPANPVGTVSGAAVWASNWEASMRKHERLAEWSDLTPTDGLHIETQLSVTSVADEHARARLEQLD
jgi:hypothetical protein